MATRYGLVRLGRILMLISIALGLVICAAALLIALLGLSGHLPFRFLSVTGALLILAVKGIGVALALVAYARSRRGRQRDAGFLALVASLFPPLDLIVLAAGLLLLVGGGGSAPDGAASSSSPEEGGRNK